MQDNEKLKPEIVGKVRFLFNFLLETGVEGNNSNSKGNKNQKEKKTLTFNV